MKSLKILALNWRDPLHPEAGGAEIHLDKILSHLAKKHRVTLISTRTTKSNQTLQHHGYLIQRIGHPFLFNFTFQYLWHHALKHQHYDIIIDDISKIGLRTPSFIKNVPIISIFHHIHGHTLYQLLPFPLALYVDILEKLALKTYKHTPIITVSQSTQAELSKIGHFDKIHILHNGVDHELFHPHPPRKKHQLCSLGRLTYAKRVDLSLELFAKLLIKFPKLRFLIAGKGDDESRLKELALKLGISESVEFLGFISDEQKKTLLSESMGLLFTSEKEGWGITAIEASACYTPVFGFRVAGLQDSVKNSVNGYLAEFGDIDTLTKSIIQYLDTEAHQHVLQQNAYKYAKQFDWERICEEFEKILYSVYETHTP